MKSHTSKPTSRTLLTVGAAALLLALVGTGGAVAGSVVTGKQIKNGTVTSADIKDRTLKTVDLAPATLTSLAGKAGPAGPAGVAGKAGVAGPAGPAGAAGVNGMTQVRVVQQFIAPSDQGGTVRVFCAADERAVAASYQTDGTNGGIPVITASYPISADNEAVLGTIPLGSGWKATLVDTSGSAGVVFGSISAICAKDPA